MEIPHNCSKNYNHMLYRLISSNKLDEARILISEIVNNVNISVKEDRGFVSLIIKFYMTTNQDKNLDKIYEENKRSLMKRDILNYCKYYYYKDYLKSLENFIFLIENYNLDSSNLEFILESNMEKFLFLLDGKFIKLEKTYSLQYVRDLSNIKKYNFNKIIVDKILEKICIDINKKDCLKLINKVNEFKMNKIIIDGGNILFFYNGKICKKGYQLLLDLINYFYDQNIIPILVIHKRHLKLNKNNNINKIIIELIKLNDEFIFRTPYNKNDDLFILFIGLNLECNIITNDNFKDHIYKFRTNGKDSEENLVEKYLEDLICKYSINFSNFKIEKLDYLNKSMCIQINNNRVCIPTTEDRFVFIDYKATS